MGGDGAVDRHLDVRSGQSVRAAPDTQRDNLLPLVGLARAGTEISLLLFEHLDKMETVSVSAHRDLLYILYHLVLVKHENKSLTTSSVARASGFPRGTVARKIDHLVRLGYVVKNGRSIDLSDSLLYNDDMRIMFSKIADVFDVSINDLRR